MITADTNLLVRLAVLDDLEQTHRAAAELEAADAVVVTLPALCELCWVLKSRYGFDKQAIADVVASIAEAENVVIDTASVAAGIAMLDAGGDFADAVIAEQGDRLGARAFVSFDRKAVSRVDAMGFKARLPAQK